MKILKEINKEHFLFIDIETVRIQSTLEKDTPIYDSWVYKMRYSSEASKFGDKSIDVIFSEKAALYAEFAKIVCITIGKVKDDKIQLKSYYNNDEKQLLEEFCKGINALISADGQIKLTGHSIIKFDIPFIIKRLLINRLDIPRILDTQHLKPWEVPYIDSMQLWNGSSYYSASLLNITTALGLPSPKSDIDGSEVSNVYYNEGDKGLERIKDYCERDVRAVADVVLILRGNDPLEADNKDIKEKAVGVIDELHNTGKTSSKGNTHIVETLNNLEGKEKEIANELLNIVTTKKK